MKFKVGEVVTLKHYSVKKSNKGIISSAHDDSIIIKPERDFLVYSFFDSDPVVMGYESENMVNICEATINFVNHKDNSFGLTVNNIQTMTNKRITQRFPVSLCAYILNHNTRVFSYIRNISLDGLSLCSKQEFKNGDVFIINTRIENIELTFEGRVIWKKSGQIGFEYGLSYHSPSAEFGRTIERCLEFLSMDQEISVNRLKYEFEPMKRTIQHKVVMN